jgi:hypothetical protein
MDRRTAMFTVAGLLASGEAQALQRLRGMMGTPGLLTIDLDQFHTLKLKYQGSEIELPARILFQELAKGWDE